MYQNFSIKVNNPKLTTPLSLSPSWFARPPNASPRLPPPPRPHLQRSPPPDATLRRRSPPESLFADAVLPGKLYSPLLPPPPRRSFYPFPAPRIFISAPRSARLHAPPQPKPPARATTGATATPLPPRSAGGATGGALMSRRRLLLLMLHPNLLLLLGDHLSQILASPTGSSETKPPLPTLPPNPNSDGWELHGLADALEEWEVLMLVVPIVHGCSEIDRSGYPLPQFNLLYTIFLCSTIQSLLLSTEFYCSTNFA